MHQQSDESVKMQLLNTMLAASNDREFDTALRTHGSIQANEVPDVIKALQTSGKTKRRNAALLLRLAHTPEAAAELRAAAGVVRLVLERRAEEARDLRRVLDEVPSGLAHLHLDKNIPWKTQLLTHPRLAPRPVLRNRLARDQDLPNLVVESVLLGPLLERIAHLRLVAGVGVNDVPLLGHGAPQYLSCRRHTRGSSRTPRTDRAAPDRRCRWRIR